MAGKFVYSNCIGTFLFSDNNEVVDKLLFSDVIDVNEKLEKNEWTDEEKKLIGNDKALFLGFKKEKLANVAFTNDLKKLEAAEKKLQQYEDKVSEAMLKIAKKKIKESVEDDELIIQAAGSVQELDKSVSMLSKRLREWHGLQNPELAANIGDNARFVKEVLEGNDKSGMGAELKAEDRAEIRELAKTIVQLLQLRAKNEKYLENRMKTVCPNLLAVAGASIGAKLLASAGSLKRLAVLPASTVQLLGAERSMFNFLRKKSKKMPRFGILHEHKLIASAIEKEKGKMARLLADKISIAARVDYFKGKFIGDKLLKQIEDRSK
ncbi:NOP58 family protein [Candidatus Woesearchaeota archaeon]|nr:NOP58 family protein [Candidatus Woesearchaeota archaeon]